jgi:hypothetical protein
MSSSQLNLHQSKQDLLLSLYKITVPKRGHGITSILASTPVHTQQVPFILTGGHDGIIRYWNLRQPQSSYHVVSPYHMYGNGYYQQNAHTYQQQYIASVVSGSNTNNTPGNTGGVDSNTGGGGGMGQPGGIGEHESHASSGRGYVSPSALQTYQQQLQLNTYAQLHQNVNIIYTTKCSANELNIVVKNEASNPLSSSSLNTSMTSSSGSIGMGSNNQYGMLMGSGSSDVSLQTLASLTDKHHQDTLLSPYMSAICPTSTVGSGGISGSNSFEQGRGNDAKGFPPGEGSLVDGSNSTACTILCLEEERVGYNRDYIKQEQQRLDQLISPVAIQQIQKNKNQNQYTGVNTTTNISQNNFSTNAGNNASQSKNFNLQNNNYYQNFETMNQSIFDKNINFTNTNAQNGEVYIPNFTFDVSHLPDSRQQAQLALYNALYPSYHQIPAISTSNNFNTSQSDNFQKNFQTTQIDPLSMTHGTTTGVPASAGAMTTLTTPGIITTASGFFTKYSLDNDIHNDFNHHTSSISLQQTSQPVQSRFGTSNYHQGTNLNQHGTFGGVSHLNIVDSIYNQHKFIVSSHQNGDINVWL